MEYLEIAKTIREQIITLGGRIVWCWGINWKKAAAGKDLSIMTSPEGDFYKDENCLGFLRMTATNLRIGKKIWVYVSLDGTDTYTVLVVKPKRKKATDGINWIEYGEILHKATGVYFDTLVPIIDGTIETGTIELNYGKE